MSSTPPLVAHVLNQFRLGGMEHGLANLINGTPADRYRHAIVCLEDFDPVFRERVSEDVPVIALDKRPGRDFGVYRRFLRVMRELRPAAIHSRNLAGLEFNSIAPLAGIRARIHGEHGRDMCDLDGKNTKYRILRKCMRPFVSHYTAVSRDLASWLVNDIGIRESRVTQIYNGVDIDRFHPGGCEIDLPFSLEDSFVVGTVGRMQEVKDQLTLTDAFIEAVQRLRSEDGPLASRLRLVLVGDGPLRESCAARLASVGLETQAWLPGSRKDVHSLLRGMHLFVLPSLAEGISNTILEAMSSGLPVLATDVGGNAELVPPGQTGELVPAADPAAMAEKIIDYCRDRDLVARHGAAGRRRIESEFSMASMVEKYLGVYDTQLGRRTLAPLALESRS